MAKTEVKTARCETAYGESLGDKAFDYVFEVIELQKGDEIPSDEQPSSDDIRKLVNSKRVASARTSVLTKELSDRGIEKPTLENADVRLKTMIKVRVAAGNRATQAEQIARQALGMEEFGIRALLL